MGVGCVIGTSSGELPDCLMGLKANGGKDACGDTGSDGAIHD